VPTLPQLIDPEHYRPCSWDLAAEPRDLAYWIDLFCQHLHLLVELIHAEYPDTPADRVAAFERDYLDTMHAVQANQPPRPRRDVLLLTHLRRLLCERWGFPDPFLGIKRRESAAALELLPELLAELDATPPAEIAPLLARGLMAGNVFDLGSMPTIERYRSRNHIFQQARADQPPRPWHVDHLDRWLAGGSVPPTYRHAIFFVDNAGSDICLGCLPLARWLVAGGARVTFAANTGPALNDVTAEELTDLLRTHPVTTDSVLGPALAAGTLDVVPSGCIVPLLDLTALSPACVAAAEDADLIMLHGMGRAIESNYHARLTCDTLRTAVLKDPAVAAHFGGRLFDCVFDFAPAGATRLLG
jgi:type II pantothenate kinase